MWLRLSHFRLSLLIPFGLWGISQGDDVGLAAQCAFHWPSLPRQGLLPDCAYQITVLTPRLATAYLQYSRTSEEEWGCNTGGGKASESLSEENCPLEALGVFFFSRNSQKKTSERCLLEALGFFRGLDWSFPFVVAPPFPSETICKWLQTFLGGWCLFSQFLNLFSFSFALT